MPLWTFRTHSDFGRNSPTWLTMYSQPSRVLKETLGNRGQGACPVPKRRAGRQPAGVVKCLFHLWLWSPVRAQGLEIQKYFLITHRTTLPSSWIQVLSYFMKVKLTFLIIKNMYFQFLEILQNNVWIRKF